MQITFPYFPGILVLGQSSLILCLLGVPSVGGSVPTWAVVDGRVGHVGKEDILRLTEEETHLKCINKSELFHRDQFVLFSIYCNAKQTKKKAVSALTCDNLGTTGVNSPPHW